MSESTELLDYEALLSGVAKEATAIGAIKERLEAGVSVPGIEMLETYELGDRKA